ncbi:hypothetical protein DXG01_013354 [Tephrocybe rancida]|nr:hypothetical protein DXG01_013354 [Tephrocybe rancida]
MKHVKISTLAHTVKSAPDVSAENLLPRSGVPGHQTVEKIRSLAHAHGNIISFKAYLEVSSTLKLWSQLQASGVSLIDCPHNGRKHVDGRNEVADKMLIGLFGLFLLLQALLTIVYVVDMISFTIDHPAPATIFLISGDRDFSYAASILRHRRYKVVILCPTDTHSSLLAQANVHLDWSAEGLGEADTPEPSPVPLPSAPQTPRRSSDAANRWLPPADRKGKGKAYDDNDDDDDNDDNDDTDPAHETHRQPRANGYSSHRDHTFPHETEHWRTPSRTTSRPYSPPGSFRSAKSTPQSPAPSEHPPLEPTLVTNGNIMFESSAQPELPKGFPFAEKEEVQSPLGYPPVIDSYEPMTPVQSFPPAQPVPMTPTASGNASIPAFVVVSQASVSVPKAPSPPTAPVETKTSVNTASMPAAEPQSSSATHVPTKAPPFVPASTSMHKSPLPTPVATKKKLSGPSTHPSQPKSIPSHFAQLIAALEKRAKGNEPQVKRTVLGDDLSKIKGLYAQAKVSKFASYILLAQAENIVTTGGSGSEAWVSLRPEWSDPAQFDSDSKVDPFLVLPDCCPKAPTPSLGADSEWTAGPGAISSLHLLLKCLDPRRTWRYFGTMHSGYDIVKRIRHVAHTFGSIKLFKAYLEISDPATFTKSLVLRSELQSSGVSLTDCPHNGRKDVADKMMLVDMLAYAIDKPPPSTIILISGDRDFAYAVSVLRLRRYRVVIISLAGVHTSLKIQASTFLDWNDDVMCAEIVDDFWTPHTSHPFLQGDERRPVSNYRRDISSPSRNFPRRGDRPFGEDNDIDIMDHLHSKRSDAQQAGPLGPPTNTRVTENAGRGKPNSPPPTTPPKSSHEQEELSVSATVRSPSRTESAPAVMSADDVSSTLSETSKPSGIDSGATNNIPLVASGSGTRISLSETQSFSGAGSLFGSATPPTPSNQLLIKAQNHQNFTPLAAAPNTVLTSSPSHQPLVPPNAQLHTVGTTLPVSKGNATSPSLPPVQQSQPKTVPPIFTLLVKRLEFHRSKGFSRPFRSGIAVELATTDNLLYKRAGVERFGQYVALAEKAGIIELGGKEGGAWIALKPDRMTSGQQFIKTGAKGYKGADALDSICAVAGSYGTITGFNLYYERTMSNNMLWASSPGAFKIEYIQCDKVEPRSLLAKLTTDMFLFALDTPVPATIVLMSGASAFDYPLSSLRSRGYQTVLGVPAANNTSVTRLDSGIVLDWQMGVLDSTHHSQVRKQSSALPCPFLELDLRSLVDVDDAAEHRENSPVVQNPALYQMAEHVATTASRGRLDKPENAPLARPSRKHDRKDFEAHFSSLGPSRNPISLDQESEKHLKGRPNLVPPLTDKTRDPNAPNHLKCSTLPSLNPSSVARVSRLEGAHGNVAVHPSTQSITNVSLPRLLLPSSSTPSKRPPTQSAFPDGEASYPDLGTCFTKGHDLEEPSAPHVQPGNYRHSRYSGSLDETLPPQERHHPHRRVQSAQTNPGHRNDAGDSPPFAPLIKVLLVLQDKGEERPLRSRLGTVFSRGALPADITDLGHYTKLAEQAGVVELGGKGGTSWISLVPGMESHP